MDAGLRVGGVRRGQSIGPPGDVAHDVTEEEISVPVMLERGAKLRAFDAVPRVGLVAGGLMALLVQVSDELFQFDGRAGRFMKDEVAEDDPAASAVFAGAGWLGAEGFPG